MNMAGVRDVPFDEKAYKDHIDLFFKDEGHLSRRAYLRVIDYEVMDAKTGKSHIIHGPFSARSYSEFCGVAGFSLKPVVFFPEDSNPLSRITQKTFYEDYIRIRHTREEHKDNCPQDCFPYSVLPKNLWNCCLEISKYPDVNYDRHTRDCMVFDSHNPFVWQIRRVLIHLRDLNLQDELNFLELLARESSDNYLYWHHRRWVSEKIGSSAAKKELEFTDNILSKDPNNYHAWSHRQWVLQVVGGGGGGWEDELTYCGKILEKDASNSFAWDQRYFVVTNSPWRAEDTEAMRNNEVKYALDAIRAEPEKEMPWTYLKCLVKVDTMLVKNNNFLQVTCTSVLGNAINHRKDLLKAAYDEHDVCVDDAYVKKRVVNALKMVLYLVKHDDYFKPSLALIETIDALCPSKAEGYVEKVVSILQSMDVTWIGD